MKKILAAALLLLVHFSNAQSFLNGFVVDAHNSKPLAFATVQLPELHLLVYSDSSGKFSIQNLPEGNFILKVSYIGYESLIQTVSVSQAKNILPIKLEPIELETEEVVIYGTHQNDWRNTPMDIVSLGRDDISGRGNLSLSSAIAKLPGMGEMTTGGISKPVIRGLYGNRIQTQVLGIRFDNMQFQDEHGLGLSDAGVERVEIIKGPASLSYGSDAMGGVINVIEENPARTGKTEMDVNLKSFSNTLGYAADAGWKKATQKWNLRLRLGTESHADYIDGNGSRIFNTRTGGYVAKASAGFRKPHWVMQNNYMFSHYNFGFVLNPAEFDSSLLDARGSRSFDIPHHTVLFNIFSSENTFFKGLSKVKLNFGFHSNNRMEREGGNKISLNMLLSTGNLTLQWNHPLEHKGEWTLGTDAMFQNNTNLGSRIIIPDADFFEDGIYFTVNLPVKKIVIEAGARFDYKMIQTFETGYLNTVDTVYINAPGQNIIPFSRTYTVANGAAGVSWNPSKDLNLKLNVASGFRAPNLAELSSKGLHEGTYRWEIGNPDLKSEQNLNTELQINFEADDLRLTAAAYVNS
ncbi:MAG TPA: hypothetical protein DCQ93_07710, partial [Bacteroidetes bacterium]|nr:hypothetical protein [Bacteroidota bacterium]